MTKQLTALAVLLILVAILGSSIWSFYPRYVNGPNIDYVIGITAFSIGVITFFGVAGLNSSGKEHVVLKGERLRTSIACALVLSYLYMVTFSTYVANAPKVGTVTEKLLESFSSVIGITLAFYFGASAATQIFAKETREVSETHKSEPS
jgi:O-antigen ligase